MPGSVCIDISAAVNGRAGLGRYATALAAALIEQHPDQIRLFGNFTAEGRPLPELAAAPLRAVRMGYKPWRMAVWLGQILRFNFERLIGPADVYHATEHLLIPLRHTPTILTVHDLIYRLFPQHHKKLNYWYLNAAMPLFVRRADHIIAVSHSTRRDLIQHYDVPDEKITVVHEAAAPTFVPQPPDQVERVRRQYSLPDRYLLAVGTIEPRKNYARLVEALASLRRDDPDLRLVIAGPDGWLTEGFYQAIERHGQADAVIRPGWVADDDLPALMAGATALAQPSIYEGFGLPVLEAMAVGTPVACSHTSSLSEIAGDAALTFDPEDGEALTAMLRRLLNNAVLRDELREKGRQRAAGFSWERAARETWTVYERVAQ